MIKKLRRKFVIVNMSLVSALLLLTFITLCVTTYARLKADTENAANAALRFGDFQNDMQNDISRNFQNKFQDENTMQEFFRPEIGRPDFKPDRDMARNIPTFTVTVSVDGEILNAEYERVSITEETTEIAVKETLKQKTSKGKIKNLNLRFATETAPNGDIKIAFADTSAEKSGMIRLIFNSLIIGAVGLVALFFISLFLARLAVKPVEKAWKTQQQFIADAAHELKTPLTVIMANTGILSAHPETPVAKHMQWLNNTTDEAEHMKSLIENMLELAKGDFAKGNLILSSVNLSDIVTNKLLSFEPIAFEKNVVFESEIMPYVSIQGDSERLGRLCGILFDNAVKYAGNPGNVFVKLSQTTSHTVLQVKNNGEPIPAESLEHIFDRFYRADKSRTAGNIAENTKSYGLGLSIAMQIALEHSAKINVSSTKDTGTIFTVQFKKK
ncbi:MAG: HAMP domain-containing histidine kinase [Ruminococcus sp.]|jgi:signal transduction histidine kinase|nr:HAMP domain-containing histidine kinase [Ruminococcus sp.]